MTSAAKLEEKFWLALKDDKVFVPTSDLHVLALDAKTGEVVWDHTIVPPTTEIKAGDAIEIVRPFSGG